MLEWLKAILGDEYTEEIDTKVSAEIGKAFVSKADFKAAQDAKKLLEDTVKARDAQLAELSKTDTQSLQNKIEQLQQENEQAKQNYEVQLKQQKVDAAVTAALANAQAKNIKAAKALLDLDGAELQDDGTVKGLTESIEKLKTAEDSKFLFEAGKKETGLKGFEPASGKDGLPGDSQIKSFSLAGAIKNALTNND